MVERLKVSFQSS